MTKLKLPKVDDTTIAGHVEAALVYLTRSLADGRENEHNILFAISHIKAAKKHIPEDLRGAIRFLSPIYAETDTAAIRGAIGYLVHVHEQIEAKNLVTAERLLDDAITHLKPIIARGSK